MAEKSVNKNYLSIGSFIFGYRYFIAAVILLFCVIFELSGSSIGCWNNYFDEGTQNHTVFGFSRPIRSDEWRTNTPMAFSQCYNTVEKFPYFSSIVSTSPMDMFIVYGQPVKSIAVIFRPFLIGYLFLGAAKGLSFFWCARLILLFMVSFEFGRLITDDNCFLAFIQAVFITLAPVVQWWFAVNSTAELLIFSQFILLLINAYMQTQSYKKRIIYMLLTVWSAGSFILVFYPAWQIPLAYIMLGFLVWIIYKNRKRFKFTAKDILIIAAGIFLLGLSMGYICLKSAETIRLVSDTVYPGKRFELGGGCAKDYIKYVCSFLLPVKQVTDNMSNNCEAAAFFDLFPAGYLLSLWVFFAEKKKDPLLMILTAVSLFFGIWCVFGFNSFFARITLMYAVTPYRCIFAAGILNVFILIKACSLIKKMPKRLICGLVSLILASLLILSVYKFYGEYINGKYLVLGYIYIFTGIYLVLNIDKSIEKRLFLLYTLAVFAFCGGLVNPIEKGTGALTENELFKKIREIDSEDEGIWLFEGEDQLFGNMTLAAGVHSLGATNVYPDFGKWSLLDEKGDFKSIYNRYAHIDYVYEDIPKCRFELANVDYILVHINTEGLKKLNTQYIISQNRLETYKDGELFEKIYEISGFKIYKTKF